MVELCLLDLSFCAFDNDAAGTYIVQIVQVLGRVLLHLFAYGIQGTDSLTRQSYIIIIGGGDNGQLALGIDQPLLLTFVKRRTLLVDTLQRTAGLLTIVVELTVARLALTQAHLLNIADQQFQLVVCNLSHLVQQRFGLGIVHLDDTYKGQMIQGLCLSVRIVVGMVECLLGIKSRRINVTIMIGIRNTIQLVHRLPILR